MNPDVSVPADSTASEFSVVALIAAYNEADIIGQVVADLLAQNVSVYLIDDGSTDGTAEAIEPYVGHGVLAVERTGAAHPDRFHWERLLRRKEMLAEELDADWFIHHDADELRDSPWPHSTLGQAIEQVDALGFNAIDFAVVDFRPTDESFAPGDDPRHRFAYYAPPAPYDRLQIRAWKKTPEKVDLVSSGGHEARFTRRDVFPIRFVLRHYPIRGDAHGRRKIFQERRGRFVESERAKGWHVQYDGVDQGQSLLHSRESLLRFDEASIRRSLPMRERSQPETEEVIAGLQSTLETCRTDLRRREAELEDRDARLTRTRRELELRGAELATAHETLASETDKKTALERDLQVRHLQVDALQRRLDAQTDDAETWRAAAESLSRELSAMRQSLSWKWMAPARAALRLLRGW